MKETLKINQKVKTFRNEIGIIEKECARPEWDWWVKIQFRAKNRDFECLEPYKEEELEIVDETDGGIDS